MSAERAPSADAAAPARLPSPMATAALTLLGTAPAAVVALCEPLIGDGCEDAELLAAVALGHVRTGNAAQALPHFLRLCVLRPADLEVVVCTAESAIEAMDLAVAVSALETAFALDVEAATPAGRRARALAFKLEKKLAG